MRGTVKKLSITRLDACDVATARARVGTEQVCPTCGGTGQVTQTSGKMRFKVTCSRCGGTGRIAHDLPQLRRRRPRAARGNDRSAHSGRRANRLARARCRTRQRGTARRRRRAISTSSLKVQPHPFFDRRGRRSLHGRADHGDRSGAGRQDGSADDRRALAGARSARDQQRAEAAPARKGRAFGAAGREARRPERRSAGGGAQAGGRARPQFAERTRQDGTGRSAQRNFRARDACKEQTEEPIAGASQEKSQSRAT